jgi:hypothetical protein
MPRWGQISRRAATAPCAVRQRTMGRPSRTMPLTVPGPSSALGQPTYQNPSSGALLAGLSSVIRSMLITMEGCLCEDRLRLRKQRACDYNGSIIARQACPTCSLAHVCSGSCQTALHCHCARTTAVLFFHSRMAPVFAQLRPSSEHVFLARSASKKGTWPRLPLP